MTTPSTARALLCLFAIVVSCVTLFQGPASAQQRRLALVVGIDNYESVSKLQKAVNDADAVSKRLAEIGFEVVTAKDVGRRAMSRAILEFENKIQPGDLTLFYFAGHGFAVDGQNFLLPADIPDAKPGEAGLVKDEAYLADRLAARFKKAGAAATVLVLDACRNNPFEQPGKRSLGGEGGLNQMEPVEGMFVLFSAGVRQFALDRLDDNDADPNSVFTRTFLTELTVPGASMVDIAKSTQLKVRKLAEKVGYTQTPAYYDQIIGNLTLLPDDGSAKVASLGTSEEFEEGGGQSVLRKLDPAPKGGPAPLANFSRHNGGWSVYVSLPEPATQFGYRIGEEGEFKDAGLSNILDQRTGRPTPNTLVNLPPDQKATTLYVTWRDKRGEEAGVYPIIFDPDSSLKSEMKKMLELTWTSWLGFRDFNGQLVYFTQLASFRCGLKEIRYSIDNGDSQVWELPACDPNNPYAVPENTKLFREIPKSTKNMQVQVTYFDGEKSELRNFNVLNQ